MYLIIVLSSIIFGVLTYIFTGGFTNDLNLFFNSDSYTSFHIFSLIAAITYVIFMIIVFSDYWKKLKAMGVKRYESKKHYIRQCKKTLRFNIISRIFLLIVALPSLMFMIFLSNGFFTFLALILFIIFVINTSLRVPLKVIINGGVGYFSFCNSCKRGGIELRKITDGETTDKVIGQKSYGGYQSEEEVDVYSKNTGEVVGKAYVKGDYVSGGEVDVHAITKKTNYRCKYCNSLFVKEDVVKKYTK